MTNRENYTPGEFARHFWTRWERYFIREAFVDKNVDEKALALTKAGFTLIPSTHLHDNEVAVSQAVYDRAKEILQDLK